MTAPFVFSGGRFDPFFCRGTTRFWRFSAETIPRPTVSGGEKLHGGQIDSVVDCSHGQSRTPVPTRKNGILWMKRYSIVGEHSICSRLNGQIHVPFLLPRSVSLHWQFCFAKIASAPHFFLFKSLDNANARCYNIILYSYVNFKKGKAFYHAMDFSQRPSRKVSLLL